MTLTITDDRAVDAGTLAAVREWAAGRVAAVDAGETSATEVLAHLGGLGVLDAGVQGTVDAAAQDGVGAPGSVRVAAALLRAVAAEDLASAFSLWGHRMALDYLARGRREGVTQDAFADLRAGRRAGSTAMAAAMKQASGIGTLGVTGRREGEQIVLDGSVAWASNLVDGAVVVSAVDLPEGAVVLWFAVGAPGVTVQPARGLLALDATASGRIVLDGVRVPASAVLTDDLGSFLAGCRPVLLLLQTAFCLGLARACVDDAREGTGRPETAALGAEVEALAARLDDLEARWERAVDDPSSVGREHLLRVRLDASHVTQDATRLGVAVAGGRGYAAASTAARRLREAAFLPVQSPSEGHLLWDLQSSR